MEKIIYPFLHIGGWKSIYARLGHEADAEIGTDIGGGFCLSKIILGLSSGETPQKRETIKTRNEPFRNDPFQKLLIKFQNLYDEKTFYCSSLPFRVSFLT